MKRFIFASFIGLLLLSSCASTPDYHVVSTQLVESPNKARVTIRAVFDLDSVSDTQAEGYLREMYQTAMKTKFENFTIPIVVSIYLYSSERKMKEDKSAFRAMLLKTPIFNAPEISMSVFEQSPEGKADFERMQAEFKAKGTDLCQIYYEQNTIIKQSHIEADKKYAISSVKNEEYHQKYIDEQVKALFGKYSLPDSLSEIVMMYGASYCK